MNTEQKLADQLNTEFTVLQQLLLALREENKALVENSIEAIETATTHKQLALEQQHKALLARQQFTNTLSLPTGDETALQKFIGTCESHNQLNLVFNDINKLAQECHALNRTNGKLIQEMQQHTHSALNILRQTESSSPLYSNHGNAKTSLGPARILGKA